MCLLVQAESGLVSVNGAPGPWGRIGVSICDITAGMNAVQGILEALLLRERTGQGSALHVSLFDAAAELMAVPYLQAFGHLVLAWIWLDVSASCRGEASPKQTGRQAAAKYFYRYELPKIDAWLHVVGNRDMTCANLSEEAF
mgnify:CR=1 FL=1